MILPLTRRDQFCCVATETARMSYPGSMSRGTRPVVSGGTKAKLEEYFVHRLPLKELWLSCASVAASYETWHQARVGELALEIGQHVRSNNVPMSVAAKFLNTFMYQLTKYEEVRPLVNSLHLPLDARVFRELSRIKSRALDPVAPLFCRSPYALPYESHLQVQNALLAFVEELNTRPGAEFAFSSRIQLNWLWL